MIKPEDIPPEVVEALRPGTCCGCDKCLSKALATALNAWPGMTMFPGMQRGMRETPPFITLPLKENTSDD